MKSIWDLYTAGSDPTLLSACFSFLCSHLHGFYHKPVVKVMKSVCPDVSTSEIM